MPLQQAHVIDLIAQDPATNVVVLGMTEVRPWDGSDRRVYELQEKVNAYLSFALDGEMEQNFPQFVGKAVRLQLDCVEEPDEKTDYFIGVIREQIGFQEIEFLVRVVPELAAEAAASGECCGGGGGGGCACESAAAANGTTAVHSHPTAASGCCGGGGASEGGGCGCS